MAKELGTGQVESHEDRPIIHFGSPVGSRYVEEGLEATDLDKPVGSGESDGDDNGLGVA